MSDPLISADYKELRRVPFGRRADSGVWVNPLFPDPSIPAPGTWVQHSAGRAIQYTSYADAADLLLIQSGTVRSGDYERKARLKAYSTVSTPAIGLVAATVLSRGYEVENAEAAECPLPPPPPEEQP